MAAAERSMFGYAVSKVLDSWTALQLAVEQGFGGAESREKAEWMVYAIETWFRDNDNIETYEMEDFLEDVLNTEFDLRVEDGSVEEIARLVCLYYRLSQEEKIEELQQKLKALPKAAVHACQQGETEAMDELDSDEGASSSHPSASNPPAASYQAAAPQEVQMEEEEEVDEEGWRVIHRGRKKK